MTKKIKFISTPDLCKLYGLERRAIYARLKLGLLPEPVYKNGSTCLWLESDIKKLKIKKAK